MSVGSLRIGVPSPTASSLGKFGDIPVSLYTGLPDIEIPLYTVNLTALKRYIFNRPVSVYTTGGAEHRYYNDHNGNRVRKRIAGSSDYYVNGIDGRTDVVTNSTSSWATYTLYGLDQIGQVRRDGIVWTRFYYLKDHVGSVRVIVNASGHRVAHTDMDPFGYEMPGRVQGSSSVDGRYMFTAKERDDETKYDSFGARYYDARIARWLQVDPLAEKYVGNSPFVYSFNNPIRYYDPDGNLVVESKRGGVIAHRYSAAEYRTTQVLEFLPLLSTASIINRTLRGDPSFSPGAGTWAIHGAAIATGFGLGSLTTFMKHANPIEKAIVKFIAQRSEVVVSLPTIELEKGSKEMIAQDKSIFERALSTVIEEGITLAVPAKFVTTKYYGKGEREGYYEPDLEWSGGATSLIMLNPKLEERWREEGVNPKEEFLRWLESFKLVLFIFLIPILLLSCRNKNNEVVLSDDIVVFIESRSTTHSITSGSFGDIVLYDLNNGKQQYITDDVYYNKQSTISYDQEHVAFLSNRVGTRTQLKIKGVAPPHEIYIFNIKEMRLKRFGEKLERRYPDIMNGVYYGLKWNSEGNSLYFCNGKNKIYEIFIEYMDSLRLIKTIVLEDWKDLEIIDFSFSPDNNLLAAAILETRYSLSPRRKLIIYDLELGDSSIIYNTSKALNVGAWSKDGKKLLFREYKDIYEYCNIERKVEKIFDQSENEVVRFIDRPYYTNDGHIIFLAQRIDVNQNNQFYGIYELFLLDIQNEKLTQITSDGHEKRYLDVSYK
jgi:RHS repeat-associated protein